MSFTWAKDIAYSRQVIVCVKCHDFMLDFLFMIIEHDISFLLDNAC